MGRQPVRLYSKGTFVGFPSGRHHQNNDVALVKIEGVQTKEDTKFYQGKRIAYVYRAHRKRAGDSKIRVIWGKVVNSHGNSGAVRARFRNNLPPRAMGAQVRVMLYPSTV